MNPVFPPALAAAISQLLDGVSRNDLRKRASRLSAAYRAGQSSGLVTSWNDVLAYLLARAPATFAAVSAVLARTQGVAADFTPVSLLDVGAGPGTAAHAAMAVWPSLSSITLLEPNPAFRDVAAHLMPTARIVAADLSTVRPKAELVIAAYLMAELPEAVSGGIARDLWSSAQRMLVLVEPGTSQGFARIRKARAVLIEMGGHIVAPCTHDNPCPISGTDWCHFSQRLPRSRDHMILKGASVPFEDERYAYVVAMRESISAGARIIKPPVESKSGFTLPLCDESGLRNLFVMRRDKDAYRRSRKLDWGDLI